MINKHFKPRLSITKRMLKTLYVTKKIPIRTIALQFGCGTRTVSRLRRIWNIKRRTKNIGRHPKRFDVTKEFLVREYVNNHKTMKDVGNIIKCSSTHIIRKLREFKIPTRKRGEDLKGIRKSPELKRKLSISLGGRLSGKNHPNWRGGVSFNAKAIRRSFQYNRFRRLVLSLRGDNCEKCGVSLLDKCITCNNTPDRHVHHIKPFSRYQKQRFSEHNVLVLCNSCHKSQHTK